MSSSKPTVPPASASSCQRHTLRLGTPHAIVRAVAAHKTVSRDEILASL